MFKWFKKLFSACEHDFEFTRKPIKTKRWVEDNDVPIWASESYCLEHSYWEYGNAIEVVGRCKKCGKKITDLE